MSAGPGTRAADPATESPHIAGSAVVAGRARMGGGSSLAQGTVVLSIDSAVEIGSGSYVLENSVVVGQAQVPTTIGRRTVFGHRCTVIGAIVGDLCEIGNGSTLMPGAPGIGFSSVRHAVPAGMTLPDDVVAVGRPANRPEGVARNLRRLTDLRGGPLASASDHHRRRRPTGDTRGPAVRVPRHRADHRRVGDVVPHR
jgi:carbonic anhydrase/acetyltransferase-like protein (isoleucine patch superfamily)